MANLHFPKESVDALSRDLRKTLAEVLETAEDDLREMAEQIAPALVTSVVAGDDDLTDELKAQIRGLAEINRLNIAEAGLNTLLRVTQFAFNALIMGVRSVRT